MKCSIVEIPGVGRAIVCGSRRYEPVRCPCGSVATLLCDHIMPQQLGLLVDAIAVTTLKTCDAPLCEKCTTSPAPGRDLCPAHREG